MTFVEPRVGRALHELARLPACSPPSRRGLTGAAARGQRSRIVRSRDSSPDRSSTASWTCTAGPMALPPGGLVLSLKLAQVLGSRVGDQVEVEVLDGTPCRAVTPVAGIVERVHGHVRLHGPGRASGASPARASSLTGAYLLSRRRAGEPLYRAAEGARRLSPASAGNARPSRASRRRWGRHAAS